MKIDKRKKYYLMFDCETANTLENPLIYDMGGVIIDKKGKVYAGFSFLIKDIFIEERELMQSAYYSEKIPQYWNEYKKGKYKIKTLLEARKYILALMKKFNCTTVIAHNMRFDYNALNTSIRYLTKSKIRYFLPYDTKIWCTLAMARSVIGKMTTYKWFCEKKPEERKTKKNQLRFTAEILYQFLTNDNDYKERHTGLDDALIEKEIFAYVNKQKKKTQRTYWKEKKTDKKITYINTPIQWQIHRLAKYFER